jgi:hypothetical protein
MDGWMDHTGACCRVLTPPVHAVGAGYSYTGTGYGYANASIDYARDLYNFMVTFYGSCGCVRHCGFCL